MFSLKESVHRLASSQYRQLKLAAELVIGIRVVPALLVVVVVLVGWFQTLSKSSTGLLLFFFHMANNTTIRMIQMVQSTVGNTSHMSELI